MERRTCGTCIYINERYCCQLDPPHIVGLNEDGIPIQFDPKVHTDRIGCKWHMTGEESRNSETIRMA
jgi:hypothetical protein